MGKEVLRKRLLLPQKSRRMRFIDCCTFYNEVDMLFYRLSLLSEYVDKFVIVESTRTFAGHSKPSFFLQNKARFEPFLDRIVHIIDPMFLSNEEMRDDPNVEKYWKNENQQRNFMHHGIVALNLEAEADPEAETTTYLTICDVDEIPNPALYRALRSGQMKPFQNMTLAMHMYYYNLTCYMNESWEFPKMISYKHYKAHFWGTPQAVRVRNESVDAVVENGGWHLSYFGDAQFVSNKMKNFAHMEYSDDQFANVDHISRHMENCASHIGNTTLTRIPVAENKNLPPLCNDYLSKFMVTDIQ